MSVPRQRCAQVLAKITQHFLCHMHCSQSLGAHKIIQIHFIVRQNLPLCNFNSLSLVLCSKNMQNNFNFLPCSVNLTKTSFSSFLGRHLRANSIYDYSQNESLKFSYDGKLEGKVVWNFPLLLILVKKTKHYRCGPSRFHFPRICSRNNGIYESSSPLTQKSDQHSRLHLHFRW